LASLGACVDAPEGQVGVYLPTADAALDATDARHGDIAVGPPGDATAGLPTTITLNAYIRDFREYDKNNPTTNPAFDNGPSERGVVEGHLGSDGRPVYHAPTSTLPTFGRAYFDQWYRDIPDTNVSVVYPLTLTLTSDGQYEYDSRKLGIADTSTGVFRRVFTPIDDGTPYATPFGNEGKPHNYCFTAELHSVFTLKPGGGLLRFRSDDDAYVFIDKKLVIDLGGTHAAMGQELDVESLGLTVGQDYAIDIFYAERMGKTGDLLLTTTFELRADVH